MFQTIAPIFPALNIQITALFYRDKLDFEISWLGNYMVATKGHIQVYFFEDRHNYERYSCFIFVSNIEDMYAKFSSMGMLEAGGMLEVKPGNLKTFRITDNNGHELLFAEKP